METTILQLAEILVAMGITNVEYLEGGGHDYLEIPHYISIKESAPTIRVAYTAVDTPNIEGTRFAVYHSASGGDWDTTCPLACSPLSDVLHFCLGWWTARP